MKTQRICFSPGGSRQSRRLPVLRTGNSRFASLALGIFLAAQLSACGVFMGGWQERGDVVFETTYQKFLARAEAGHAESQNAVGFMLFHGEGVTMDRARAQAWFQQAAAQGNVKAQRNLAIMHTLGGSQGSGASGFGVSLDRGFASAPPAAQQPGESLYEKFCAGCHGFNGFSAYVHSPSFAVGETLEKGDDELMRSLLRGKGAMPNWDDKFSYAELHDVLRFVRTLQPRYELGIGQTLRSTPGFFFLFGPMATEPPRASRPTR